MKFPWKLKRKPVIEDLVGHVDKHYGPGFRLLHKGELEGFPITSMSRFDAQNHCTLASLTAVFDFYREQGFSGIPKEEGGLFQSFLKEARENFYYFPWIGTTPLFIPPLARSGWRRYGYRGGSKNHFFLKNPPALFDKIKEEIDSGRPLLMNFVFGPYRKHTVTCMGYASYINGGRKLYFAMVADNWSWKPRYVDLQKLGWGGLSLFSVTTVRP